MRSREFINVDIGKNQDLYEINMNPSNLANTVASIQGVRVGIEFEMIVPGVISNKSSSEDFVSEPDFESDQRIYRANFEDIGRWFRGDHNSRYEVEKLIEELENDYYGSEWLEEYKNKEWLEKREKFIKDIINDEDGSWFEKKAIKIANRKAGDFGVNADEFKVMTKEIYNLLIDREYKRIISNDSKLSEIKNLWEKDEWDDSDSTKIREWLEHNDYYTMKDIYDGYSEIINWPYWTDYDESSDDEEDTGEGDSIAYDFGYGVGVNAIYSKERYENKNPEDWRVEPDSSIGGYNEKTHSGLEFVTPDGGLELSEMLEKMEEVYKWAVRYRCKTNDTTGLHINVSIPELNEKTLDYVKLVLLLGDEYVLEQFKRLGNSYAESSLEMLKNKADAANPGNIKNLYKNMRDGLNHIGAGIIARTNEDRYYSVNYGDKKVYIEFRGPGGNWLNKNIWSLVPNTIFRFVVAINAACNPEKYRNEYLKKLYSILQPANDEYGDMIDEFSKYMASIGGASIDTVKTFRKQSLDVLNREKLQKQYLSSMSSGGTNVPFIGKYWWKVRIPGTNMSIEVVGNDAEEAIQNARDAYANDKTAGPMWKNATNIRALPIRKYQTNESTNMRSREFINESPELAEKYKAHLIKTLPLLMNFLSKTSKDYVPTEDEMLDVVETGYEVMLQSGDKNKAGEAVRNKLKSLMNKKSVMESLYVDVPNEKWLQDKIDYTKSKGRDKFGAPFFTSTTAYFKQNVRVPIQILRRLPGIEGEQQNVRTKDLIAIKKIMKSTGKLPMHNNKEYVPYVRVAYNGEAWVFNGNHRIMAAAELFDEGDKRFSELPINLSYHDGGERVKSGPLSPEKIGNQNVMEGSYREGGSITHDGVEYDFDSVMSIAEKMPTKTCSVDKLSWVLQYDTPNKERLESADITVPLIVTKSVNGKLAAIDGLHRLAKAVRDNVKTLPVKYIKPSELESAKLNKQGVSEAVQNFNIGYHVTKKQNVPFIMKNGLVGGKTSGFTLGGEWADAIYGRRPIYVALDKDLYKDTETTELKIDLRGLRLVPDLPSLIDLGAMVSNNDSIYWEHDEDIPKLLMDYAEDGEIFYYDLLKNENVIRAAILSTRTAAILDSIPANKISTEFYRQGVAEAWSKKYKRSINCNNPRGFSQRAHCAGRKKRGESK